MSVWDFKLLGHWAAICWLSHSLGWASARARHSHCGSVSVKGLLEEALQVLPVCQVFGRVLNGRHLFKGGERFGGSCFMFFCW